MRRQEINGSGLYDSSVINIKLYIDFVSKAPPSLLSLIRSSDR